MIPMSLIAALTPCVATQNLESAEDRPRVAIIQYESGRILVVQDVGGELQAIESHGDPAAIAKRYLRGAARPASHAGRPRSAAPDTDVLFFNPGWYSQALINTNPPLDNSRTGRATERLKQNASEAEQQAAAQRQHLGIESPTTLSGRVYPLTASRQQDQAELDRLRDGTASPDVTFFSLGRSLETYRQRELAARKEMALLTYDALMTEGLHFAHARQYGQAARSFIAAADKDHGDAGSRLHAAQALMATGIYDQAMVHVRRAFELSPALMHRPLNHRASYTFPHDFDEQLARLEAYVADSPDDDDAAILLAYEQFFSDQPAQARAALQRIRPLAQHDRFAWKLLKSAEPLLGRP